MNPASLNLEEILKILPHRYPFMLVDRILEIQPGEYVRGLKNVTFNEGFFQGHFPGRPVMPGVLILEALGQTGGVLAYSTFPEAHGRMIYFMALEKVKFRQPVVPGDQLIMELTSLHRSSRAWKMDGKALVNGKLVAQAELTAAVAQA